jgi:hypothetical protein
VHRDSKFFKSLVAASPGLLLAASSFLAPLISESPAIAKLLEIGIEHSEMLSPVDPELQPGQIFRKRSAKSSQPDRWAMIPSRMAGQWKLVRKFNVSTVDLKTGRRVNEPADRQGNSITYGNSVTYIGYQTDGDDRIWTSADIESKLPHSNGTYLVPQQWELRTLNDHAFTSLKRGVSLSVDPQSNQIHDAKQLETLATFEMTAPDTLLQKYSTKWFDTNGEAFKLTEGQTEMRKTGEFQPVNDLNGIDVKSSFKQFLKARKRSTPEQ